MSQMNNIDLHHYFITSNMNKFLEAQQIIPTLEQISLDLPEIQSLDPKEIIKHKLEFASTKYPNDCVLVEDTSLSINSLNGLPGPLIKWFLQTLGPEKIAEISHLHENHRAQASVIVGVSLPQQAPQFFMNEISGTIVHPSGEEGFGWDCIFMPNNFTKSFAEMTREEKTAISMRGNVFRQIAAIL